MEGKCAVILKTEVGGGWSRSGSVREERGQSGSGQAQRSQSKDVGVTDPELGWDHQGCEGDTGPIVVGTVLPGRPRPFPDLPPPPPPRRA